MNFGQKIGSIYGDHRDEEVDRENYPEFEEFEHWVCDSVCDATDGCEIEPDGTCEHGHDSWLLVAGLI